MKLIENHVRHNNHDLLMFALTLTFFEHILVFITLLVPMHLI